VSFSRDHLDRPASQDVIVASRLVAFVIGLVATLGLSIGPMWLPPSSDPRAFAATLTILVYQPNVSIAQPIAMVCGSFLGAAIGTVLCALLGFGPRRGVAGGAHCDDHAGLAMIMLALLRIFHPPGIALAMCPALLHSGAWFPILVVPPFKPAAVISCAVLSRLVSSWPRYPAPLLTEKG
jgi:hypothetical protein